MDTRSHPLVQFWKHAYRGYSQPLEGGLGFHVPKFPGALLSPNFPHVEKSAFLARNRGLTHFNEILPLGHGQREPAPVGFKLAKQFYLGARKVEARVLPRGYSIELMPMEEAIALEEFWILITDGFAGDAPFLRALLPFLCTLEAEFETAFLVEKGKRVGVVSLGIAGGAALVLNETVLTTERGRGLSKILSDVAQNLAFERGAEHAFFWTEHAFFGKHADRVDHYRVFERV